MAGLPPPLFTGLNLAANPIVDYIQKFERYCILTQQLNERWPFLLDALIADPARITYDDAKGGHGIRADVDLAGMNPAAQAAECDARYLAR